ncbi:MAG: hypothetical protein BWY39_02011 [Spirochaetes bacterium ADurb.Bin269]|nr:MAG: hypothetical protein BWY39_02011 [Spirochaetes bacterium ADurb.Bin269]
MHRIGGNNHIQHPEPGIKTAGRTGVDDCVYRKYGDKDLRAQCSVYLADAAAHYHHRTAVQNAFMKLQRPDRRLCHRRSRRFKIRKQQFHFLSNCPYYSCFHFPSRYRDTPAIICTSSSRTIGYRRSASAVFPAITACSSSRERAEISTPPIFAQLLISE